MFGIDYFDVDRDDDRPQELPGFRGFFLSGVTGFATLPAPGFGNIAIYDINNPQSYGAPTVPALTGLFNYQADKLGVFVGDSIEYGNWHFSVAARLD